MFGDDPELLERVYPAGADRAQVSPVVAEVEGIDELLAGPEPAEGEPSGVEQVGVVVGQGGGTRFSRNQTSRARPVTDVPRAASW